MRTSPVLFSRQLLGADPGREQLLKPAAVESALAADPFQHAKIADVLRVDKVGSKQVLDDRVPPAVNLFVPGKPDQSVRRQRVRGPPDLVEAEFDLPMLRRDPNFNSRCRGSFRREL